MRLAVVTLGSAGDLHPYLAVAREMHLRGHEVYFFSQEPHRAAVEAEGLRFGAVASERDQERTLKHPALWHAVRGFGVLWRYLCVPAIQPTFEALAHLMDADPQPLTVLASPLAVGARLLREARPRLRLLTGYTAPSALRSCTDPMFLGPWHVPAWLPRAPRSVLWWALDAWKLEPMARPSLRRSRERWSLGPQRGSTFGDWIHSPDGGVALFPAWFAAAQSDWPLRPGLAGFPVFEPGAQPGPPDTGLSRFVDAGPAPVVVMAGTAAFAGGQFLAQGWEACRALGLRCVVLSAYPDQWPKQAAPGLLALPAAQLSQLLPRARALIHHGGIGTCAQALAAQTRQLILPAAFDQFDNGERVAQGGWGQSLPQSRRHSEVLTKALADTLSPKSSAAQALPDDGADWPAPSFGARPNNAVNRACALLTE